MTTTYQPFPIDGHTARWSTWGGEHTEDLTIGWENEGWTVSGVVGRERIQYVVRLNASFQVRQLLLFRDLDEPDLWLATDGSARWGEVNGAHRVDLDGCTDVWLACTPFTASIPIRRLPLHVGDSADLRVLVIDVETLAVSPTRHRYTRLDTQRWSFTDLDAADAAAVEFDVDEHGLALDQPGRFRRLE